MFAIICVADTPSEFLTRLMETNWHQRKETDEEEFTLVLVDEIHTLYRRGVELPMPAPLSTSLFLHKTPQECFKLLLQTYSYQKEHNVEPFHLLQPENFLILDERSLRDETGLLVAGHMEDGEREVETVRVDVMEAEEVLLARSVGVPGMQEMRERAEKTVDGVCRFGWREREPGRR